MIEYSFIIPVYNCKEYVEKCVNEISEIHSVDYEIVLVDDGSVDGSDEICDMLSESKQFVKCIHKKNGGVSSARNRGIDEASGKYIIFIDADDTLETDKLDRVLDVFRDKKVDVAFYGMSFDYYHNGRCYRNEALSYSESGIIDKKQWANVFYDLYSANSLSPVWNKIFRKDIIIDNNIWFNEGMFLYEDLEFSLHYMEYCNNIYNISDVIYRYRQSEDEGNSKRRLKRIDSLSVFLKDIENVVEDLRLSLYKNNIELKGYRQVLLSLYKVLLREKISVSDIKEIKVCCDDFCRWIADKQYSATECSSDGSDKFMNMVLKTRVKSLWLYCKRKSIRHKVANCVKYITNKK